MTTTNNAPANPFPPMEPPTMESEVKAEFVRCLNVMSSARASWDAYDRSREQKAAGDRAEAQALNRAREIWRDNPAMQDDLRATFNASGPLATMTEIERGAQ